MLLRLELLLLSLVLVACSDPPGPASDAAPRDATPGEVDATTPEAQSPPGLEDNFGVVESDGDSACDGLDSSHCLFPFPSDRFRVSEPDGTARLVLEGALPHADDGVAMRSDAFAGRDGWSPQTPLIFALPGLVLPTPRPVDGQPFDIAASLDDASPTVVIRADTGERVAHWIELDHFAREHDVAIAFVRIARPLAFGVRYVVAVRDLAGADGRPLPPSPGFRALRDATASTVKGVHARRAHFEAAVFPNLARAGVDRADLQLAWDFTTASELNITGPILAMRDALDAAIGPGGPAYSVDAIDEPGQEHIARLVHLTVQVPSFLLPPDERGVRALRRGTDGMPLAVGTDPVAVEIQVPHAALSSPGTAGVVQYGHGLFWSREEARKDWLREIADRDNLLIVGLDMDGMSEPNIAAWANTLAVDMGGFPGLAEWPMQGVMNHLAIQRLVRQGLAAEPALAVAGQRVFDPAKLYYYGNSQGGTLGATVMLLSRDVERGVLGVPGCAFSFLIHKSVGFASFAALIQLKYSDPYEFAAILGLVQIGFDRVEPLNLASRSTAAAPPGEPGRRLLLQVAKEDATVDNQVSFVCARAYGAALLGPAGRSVFGLDEVPSPFGGNALSEFDFGHPDNPCPFAPAPVATDTHEDLRRLRVAQDQMVKFFATGDAVHLCEGHCDPD